MKRVGLVLATGLLAFGGCQQTKEAHQQVPDEYILTNEQQARAQKAFERTKAFWIKRHIGAISVKLALPSGKETVVCDNAGLASVRTVSSEGNGVYCPGNNTIIAPALSIEVQDKISPNKLGTDFLIAHEFGHHLQDITGTLPPLFGSKADTVRLELQATCYAGMSMQQTHGSKNVAQVAAYLRELGSDDGFHGSSEAQATAFLKGATTTSC